MSDKNLDKKLPAIPLDAVINLKISGKFYNDLKVAFNDFLLEDESKESVAKILDNLLNNTVTSAKEHRLYFYFLLLASIESEAKLQEVIVYKTFEELTSSAQN
jgi:hypothetical protein